VPSNKCRRVGKCRVSDGKKSAGQVRSGRVSRVVVRSMGVGSNRVSAGSNLGSSTRWGPEKSGYRAKRSLLHTTQG
jgi:hypothetical protein